MLFRSTNDNDKAKKALAEVDKIYLKYQKLTDVYNNESELSKINNNDTNDETLTIDSDIYNILELSKEWYSKSNGLFNVNMGSVIKVWHDYREEGLKIPSLTELKNSGSIDINNIQLLGNNKIANTKPNIDLGGVVKGYATEEAANTLKKLGIDYYNINAGGNVRVGKNQERGYYRIGVESPNEGRELYSIVKVEDISVVPSGGYERFYKIDGKHYHQIISPETLMPVENMLGCTVVTKNSGIADILSTTLFLMPIEEGLKLVESMPEVEAIFYKSENNIIRSSGYHKCE